MKRIHSPSRTLSCTLLFKASTRDILFTSFTRKGCFLRKRKDKKRTFSPSVATKYQTHFGSMMSTNPPISVGKCWLCFHNPLKIADHIACGFATPSLQKEDSIKQIENDGTGSRYWFKVSCDLHKVVRNSHYHLKCDHRILTGRPSDSPLCLDS